MTDEPSPLEWATRIDDCTKAIMRHIVEPKMMDRVDQAMPDMVMAALPRFVDKAVQTAWKDDRWERDLLADIVKQVYSDGFSNISSLYGKVNAEVHLTPDQLGLVRKIIGLDT